MRVLSLGDTHGRDYWKSVNPEQHEKIVFIGDYADSHDESDEVEISNFKEIIEFKKQYPEKVVLLIGNHDLHYLYYPKFVCSRFRPSIQPQMTELFKTNEHLFQIAYQYKNYLWTHAGVSRGWFNEFQTKFGIKVVLSNIADTLNKFNNTDAFEYLHQASRYRGGDAKFAGVTWADKFETMGDIVAGLHQVVGHSRVHNVLTRWNETVTGSITYIDVFDKKKEFYAIDI